MKKLLIILLSIQILSAQQNVLYYSLLSSVVSPPPPPTPPTPPPTAYNRVNAIVQDNSGNMWFGTYVGVLKFDGTNAESYFVRLNLYCPCRKNIRTGDIFQYRRCFRQ